MTRIARDALIVAVADYSDRKLRQLRAPAVDAERLARVLRDPSIGDFLVEVASDVREGDLRRRLAQFFANRHPDDLLLVHFSCHGVKDESGELYLAATDTESDVLAATGVASAWLSDRIGRCRSKRIVVLLDCCFSGSFPFGSRMRAGEQVNIQDHLGGRGRAVITASSSMEFSYEGDELVGAGQPSFFTGAVVEALETGKADRDGDGRISVDELYDYIFGHVRERTPNQSPTMLSSLEGPLYIARSNYKPPVEPAILPRELLALIESQFPGARVVAVEELANLLKSSDPSVVLAARDALELMLGDESSVSTRAEQALAVALDTTMPESPHTLGDEMPAEPQNTAPTADRTDPLAPTDTALVRQLSGHAKRRESAVPEPEEMPTARGRWPLRAGLVAASITAAALGFFFVAHSGGARASTFRSGNLVLTADSKWRAVNSTQPWLSLKSPIAIAAAGTRIYAGTLIAPGPIATEIPQTLRALRQTYGAPELVHQLITLPSGPARRYLWPHPAGGPPLALVMIATSAGEVAIACSTRSSAGYNGMLDACMRVVATARIVGAQVESPGPVGNLNPDVASALTPLTAAGSGALGVSRLTLRATALQKLADAETTAASNLDGIPAAGRYRRIISALAISLTRESRLMSKLASAAQRNRRTAYAALASPLRRAIAYVTETEHRLRRMGFAFLPIRQVAILTLPIANRHSTVTPRPQAHVQASAPPPTSAPVSPSPATPTPVSPKPAPPSPKWPEQPESIIEIGGTSK